MASVYITGIKCQQDVSQLLDIFSEVWGAETLSEFVTSIQNTKCLLAKDDDTVVGYLFYGKDMRENFIEITDIGVRKEYRGEGCGSELVKYVCGLSPQIRLCVRSDNYSARSLYKAMGFEDTLLIQNYYGVGLDGYRMEKR
jgi:ribosomal protein S18 acetylase RimI-like enzyme